MSEKAQQHDWKVLNICLQITSEYGAFICDLRVSWAGSLIVDNSHCVSVKETPKNYNSNL